MARLSGSDRGQVALIGAFAIAVLLVVLAVVLSSAIEVEALASHGAGPESSDVIRHHDELVRTIDTLATRTYVDEATCEAEVRAGVTAWGTDAARFAASDGTHLAVTLGPNDVACSPTSVSVTYTFTYETPTLRYESTTTREVSR